MSETEKNENKDKFEDKKEPETVRKSHFVGSWEDEPVKLDPVLMEQALLEMKIREEKARQRKFKSENDRKRAR